MKHHKHRKYKILSHQENSTWITDSITGNPQKCFFLNHSIGEQNAIAEILNTANQEVKQYQQKLEALKLQKKGLMQQLLTGKVRTV